MSALKLLPKPAVALAYGEPWRGHHGVIVSDQHNVRSTTHRFGERAYYGGTLIAESISTEHAQRAADCVNFCAGVEFRPGHAYVGGLQDLLDALEQLHSRLPEPTYPIPFDGDERDETRAYNEMWRDVTELLSAMNRGPFASIVRRRY